ncbi:MAG: hypothetical protein ABI665_15160 [Vicinamibacterales bacterium]
MKVLWITLVVALVVGCAGKSSPIAVADDATVYTILASVQAAADDLVTRGQIPLATRTAIAPALLHAFERADAVNRALAAGTVAPTASLVAALRALQGELSARLAPAQGAPLVTAVTRAITLVPGGTP